jgi:GNAT superfamily N-acetyltransferase
MTANDRAPWDPPGWLGDPTEAWLRSRKISDEPEAEWTFPVFLWRAVAMSPNGLDFAYEYLQDWEETTAALMLEEYLYPYGFDGPLSMHVSLGMEVFEATLRSTTGRLTLPRPNEPYRGRHWVAAIGWDQAKEEIVFRNSWGPQWGDAGIGYIREDYFDAHVDSVLLTRPTWLGPSPEMSKAERAIAWRQGTPGRIDPDIYAKAWGTPNRTKAKTVTLNNEEHDVRRRMLYTVAGLPFDVVDIRKENDLRGRLHLVHDRPNKVSTATELWVPPPSRRRGYGSYLLSIADELARLASTTQVRYLLHQADASEVGSARAKDFARSRGLTWTPQERRRPVTIGYADRAVQ